MAREKVQEVRPCCEAYRGLGRDPSHSSSIPPISEALAAVSIAFCKTEERGLPRVSDLSGGHCSRSFRPRSAGSPTSASARSSGSQRGARARRRSAALENRCSLSLQTLAPWLESLLRPLNPSWIRENIVGNDQG